MRVLVDGNYCVYWHEDIHNPHSVNYILSIEDYKVRDMCHNEGD